jgi:hypothetical protein
MNTKGKRVLRIFQPERKKRRQKEDIKIDKKILRKRSFGRYRHRGKKNIQSGLKIIGCEDEAQIPLAKDRVQ